MPTFTVSRVGQFRSARQKKLLPQQRHVHRSPCRTVAPCAAPWWSNQREEPSSTPKKFASAKAVEMSAAEKQEVTAKINKLGRNKFLVETLGNLLPKERDRVTPDMLQQLGSVTGFTPVEMFRKFMYYVLKDRTFDEAAVGDLVHVKQGLSLSDEEVAGTLLERSKRIERKFGNLVLPKTGVSEKVLQQKAACRTFYSKLLYLTECEELLKPNDVLSVNTLNNIFGATEEDVKQLKIAEVQEVDLTPKQQGWFGLW